VPSKAQREDILRTILCEIDHSLSETQIEELASTTHGFVGADLVGLRNCANTICLQHSIEVKLKKTCNGSLDDITEEPAPTNSATNLSDHSGIATSYVSDM
jgi:SpoVK/Ycf46/Vps4 family AAA+-type ATPase